MRTSEHYAADLLVYFEGHDREHALYLALVSALEQTLPENFSVRVQKSQISFYGRHLFGAASIPVRRKKDWPPDCLMVTFGLEHRADSPRIAVATEPYLNRWTHHLLLTAPEDVDGLLAAWLAEAYRFAREKQRRA